MSHGEGRAPSDDFGRAVSRVAVAQICENVGFEGFKDDALESLSDITIRWVFDLGKIATFYAGLAGRTECNFFDLIRGLEELEITQGFLGASDSNIQCLVDSDTVKGIIRFVGSLDEIPFAQPIPRFPVIKSRRVIPSFRQMGETPPCKHIPEWLPALPDPHTYVSTPIWNERKTDPRDDKIEQARQRRRAERSLLNLQQRLLISSANDQGGSISNVPSSCAVAVSEEDEKHSPLLQKSLPTGDKDASAIVLQSKVSSETKGTDHISVLETFAPAIEAMKNGFSDDDGEEGKLALAEVRPTVHFSFRSGKKFLGESLDFRFQKKGSGRTSALTLREEERDDKKRRAEYILRQSTENPQEFNHL